jgi:hypothetical protein
MKKIFIVFVLLVGNISVYSQFEIQGVVRPRAEYRNGYGVLRDSLAEFAGFVTQRTRLNMKFTKGMIKTAISFYDFRVWGDQPLKKDLSSVGLNEGWVEIAATKTFAVKFGRQAVGYDNYRLCSKVNWNQIGAAHDLVLLKYRNNGWILDFGAAYNQSSVAKFGTDYSELIKNYKTLNFLWLRRQFGKTDIAFQSIADGYQKEGTKSTIYIRYTGGFIVKYKEEKWDVATRGFYQGGKLQTGQDVSAYYLNLDLGVKLSNKFRILGGFESLSGNDATDSLNKTDRAFNILYGSRHKFNGTMDYFSVPVTTKRAGLVNPYLKLKFNASKKVDIFADYYFFRLYGDFVNDGEIIDKNLGNEIDLKFKARILKYLKLEGGYSFLIATKSMEVIKGGDSSYFNSWAYFMITVDPVLFTSKK